jgi:hypothetical protein
MKQELTPQQIDELFAFCRRHYVHYYDVQLELVDHLANAIEEKMTTDKNISFEAALNAVYNSFGYKGFAGVVEAKQTAVSKHWRKLRWAFFKSYFTWPKAALTLLSFACVLFIHSFCSIDFQKWFLIITPAIFLISEMFISIKSYRNYKKTKNKLLVLQYGNFFPAASLNFYNIVINFYQVGIRHWFDNPSSFTSVTFFCYNAFLIFLIIFSLAFQLTTEKILLEAKAQYPQAFAA